MGFERDLFALCAFLAARRKAANFNAIPTFRILCASTVCINSSRWPIFPAISIFFDAPQVAALLRRKTRT